MRNVELPWLYKFLTLYSLYRNSFTLHNLRDASKKVRKVLEPKSHCGESCKTTLLDQGINTSNSHLGFFLKRPCSTVSRRNFNTQNPTETTKAVFTRF